MHVCGRIGILEIFGSQEPDRVKQAAVKHEFSGHKYQRRTGRDDTRAGLRPSGDALKTTKGWVWLVQISEGVGSEQTAPHLL